MAFDWGSLAAGAGTGAVYGASYGGAPGAAIGAAGGGVLSLLSNLNKKNRNVSTFDPQQQELYDQYMQGLQGQGPYADLFAEYDPQELNDLFDQSVAQPSYQNFKEEVIPGITGQYRGQNLQNSSYLGGHLAKEGSRLQQNLDTQRAGLQYQGKQQNQQNRSSAIDKLLQTQTHARDTSPNAIDALLAELTKGAGQILTKKFGG